MRLETVAERDPGKPALIDGATGRATSFEMLDERSRRLARAWRERGLQPGDSVAIVMDNRDAMFEAAWAAQRSGMSWTPVNWHLTPDEVAFIVRDCGARALVASAPLSTLAQAARPSSVAVALMEGGPAPDGFEPYEAFIATAPDGPPDPEVEGSVMYYTSGTTGQPKGVRRPWPPAPYGTGVPLDRMQAERFSFDERTVYLCPAPLYHAAPMSWSLGAHRLGGTVVLMDRFDPERALALIAAHKVTHAQMVPTMFVRLLRLPRPVRERYDLSSLQVVIHASAPCAPAVKEAMLEWWGDVLYEYYAGTEANGFCTITAQEWRTHRGSVGRPFRGEVHIVDDDDEDVPAGEVGRVFFSGTNRFEYHHRPGATAAAFNDKGWSTLGDIGYLDTDGFLYLTDRAADMIVTGGANVYPQEVENLLTGHPAVADVGVVGIPDDDMGEVVAAFVEPADPTAAGPLLEAELLAFCRDHLAHIKCPRRVTFLDALPRLETGKLARRLLRPTS